MHREVRGESSPFYDALRDLYGDLISKQARTEDDEQDLLAQLHHAMPDFLLPEWAARDKRASEAEALRLFAIYEALPESATDERDRLVKCITRLKKEADDALNHSKKWITTVLYNLARDRYRADKRHAEIIARNLPELAELYRTGVGPSAESIVMRHFEEQDIRQRILRLPPKLGEVAALLYDEYTQREIARMLGITEAAVWKRAERIRSPKIRRALGL
jgi:RNA polymerase sigma factor (sigma-70 family)